MTLERQVMGDFMQSITAEENKPFENHRGHNMGQKLGSKVKIFIF